jgi:hypothetical protein
MCFISFVSLNLTNLSKDWYKAEIVRSEVAYVWDFTKLNPNGA